MENTTLNNIIQEQKTLDVAYPQNSNIISQAVVNNTSDHKATLDIRNNNAEQNNSAQTSGLEPIRAKNSHNDPKQNITKSSPTSEKPSVSFENSMNELEKIVSALEGELELETAIQYYARGLELHKHCSEKLENAKLKVQNILHSQGKVIGLQQSGLQDEYSGQDG